MQKLRLDTADQQQFESVSIKVDIVEDLLGDAWAKYEERKNSLRSLESSVAASLSRTGRQSYGLHTSRLVREDDLGAAVPCRF